jgi:amidase
MRLDVNSRRMAGSEGIDAVMDKHKLDPLIAPTGGPATLIDPCRRRRLSPHHRPCWVHPRPAGGSQPFFGRAWSEPVLLKLAFAFEQATHHRRAPRYHRTAALEA